MEAIEPVKASEIQHAEAKEITAMTNTVLEADKALTQSNRELDLLDYALRRLSKTQALYEEKSDMVRKRLQRLATRL